MDEFGGFSLLFFRYGDRLALCGSCQCIPTFFSLLQLPKYEMEEKFGNQLSYSLALLKVFQYKKTNVCLEKLIFKEGIAVAISFAKCEIKTSGEHSWWDLVIGESFADAWVICFRFWCGFRWAIYRFSG